MTRMLSYLLSKTVIPVLFTIGPFSVYSYGLMMGIGFLVANYVAIREFERIGMGAHFANQVTLLAAVFGIAGSKILSLIESWGDFIKDPVGMAFSPGGLTWYGGFVLAAVAILWAAHKKHFKFAKVADALASPLMLGYAVARLGCHFSGDGDYGMPTKLPWGVDYSHGIVPPSIAFRTLPHIEATFPGGIVPDNTLLHPTPIYEFIAGLLIFYFLWKIRKKVRPDGKLFMIYLILAGAERLLVEFIRLNPRLLFGLSEAQLISIPIIAIGIGGLIYLNKQPVTVKT